MEADKDSEWFGIVIPGLTELHDQRKALNQQWREEMPSGGGASAAFNRGLAEHEKKLDKIINEERRILGETDNVFLLIELGMVLGQSGIALFPNVGVGGLISDNVVIHPDRPAGIAFFVPQNVAQKIADVFPEHEVINGKTGAVIAPTQTQAQPKVTTSSNRAGPRR